MRRLQRSQDSVDFQIAVTRKAFGSAFTRKRVTEPAALPFVRHRTDQAHRRVLYINIPPCRVENGRIQ